MWIAWVCALLAGPVTPVDETEGTADDEQWARLDALRDRVSESRAQLDVLKAMYPEELGDRAHLGVEPSQDLGSRYHLVNTQLLVDGEVVHTGLEPWEGEVLPGMRRVELRAMVRGTNRGVFTYLNNYEIELVSAQDIDVPPRERTVARPVAVARPGFAYSFAERPAWWWEIVPSAGVTR